MTAARGDQLSDRIGQLDRRRRWARVRAPFWFGFSMFVIALVWAMAVLLGVALLARCWSWLTGKGFEEAGVWEWAPGAILVLTVLVLASVFLVLFQAGTRGVNASTINALGTLAEPDPRSRIVNVTTEVSLGLGVTPPTIRVLDDPVANSLSIPHRRLGPTLVVTSGAERLARDELEAMVAHELVHRHAPDARWAAAAQWGVARVRSAGQLVLGLGGLMVAVAIWAAVEADTFLPTWFAGGVAFGILGGIVELLVKPTGRRLRADADRLADVGTVHLARHPEAFARLCEKVAADARHVRVTSHELDHLWFKDPAENLERAAAELRRRAVDAYTAAGYGPPA